MVTGPGISDIEYDIVDLIGHLDDEDTFIASIGEIARRLHTKH